MTRDEAVVLLTKLHDWAAREAAGIVYAPDKAEALRFAIAALTVPTSEEIEAARDRMTRELAMWERNADNYKHSGNEEMIAARNDALRSADRSRFLLRALDALAREPELQAANEGMQRSLDQYNDGMVAARKRIAELEEQIKALCGACDNCSDIAALEAKVARVRELLAYWDDGITGYDVCEDLRTALDGDPGEGGKTPCKP